MYNDSPNITIDRNFGHDGADYSRDKIGQARGAHFLHGQLKKIQNYPNRARVIASIMSPSGRINFYRQPKVKPYMLSQYIGARPLSSNDILSTDSATNDIGT